MTTCTPTSTDNPFRITSVRKERSQHWHGRIHISLDGETILENLRDRRRRPYTLYRKHILPLLREQFPEIADYRINWSQRAGCWCGCSPAFVIRPPADRPYMNFDYDLLVNVTAA
jgi:hypothetical protein